MVWLSNIFKAVGNLVNQVAETASEVVQTVGNNTSRSAGEPADAPRRPVSQAAAVAAVVLLVIGIISALNSCDSTQATLPSSGAAAFRWGSYVETDLDLATFYSFDHTLMFWFMAQYERAYEGPLLANTGTGTYLVEMGDYAAAGGKVNLFVSVNGATARYLIPTPAGYPADYPDYWDVLRLRPIGSTAPKLPLLPWRNLALVKQGRSLSVWLDGQHLLPEGSASDLLLPVGAPTGRLRLGKRTISLKERETQFYGLIDNLALFNYSMTYRDIASVLHQTTFTGNERGLRAAFLFQDLPSSTSAALQRGYTLQGSAFIEEVSATRNTTSDNEKLPMPTQQRTYRLPFKHGEIWQVLQAFNSYGSHRGYAAFCWDFIYVPRGAPIGQPQIDGMPSQGRVFVSTAGGTVVETFPGSTLPTPSASYVLIQSGPNEYHGYLHFVGSSLKVAPNTNVSTARELGEVSNVGGGGPHLHFGVADRFESQHDQLVTFPIYFSGYDASDDYGRTWYQVA